MEKVSILIEYGGIESSVGLGLQGYDGSCDHPKNVGEELPICCNRIWATSGSGIGGGEKDGIARKVGFRDAVEKSCLANLENRDVRRVPTKNEAKRGGGWRNNA